MCDSRTAVRKVDHSGDLAVEKEVEDLSLRMVYIHKYTEYVPSPDEIICLFEHTLHFQRCKDPLPGHLRRDFSSLLQRQCPNDSV